MPAARPDRDPEVVAAELSALVSGAAANRILPKITGGRTQLKEQIDSIALEAAEGFLGGPPYFEIALRVWDCGDDLPAKDCSASNGMPFKYWVDPRLVDMHSLKISEPVAGKREWGHALTFRCAEASSASCVIFSGWREDDRYKICTSETCAEWQAEDQKRHEEYGKKFGAQRAKERQMELECGDAERCAQAEVLFRELIDRAALRPHITDVEMFRATIARMDALTRGAERMEHTPKGALYTTSGYLETFKRVTTRTLSFGLAPDGQIAAIIEICLHDEPDACKAADATWYKRLLKIDLAGINVGFTQVHDWQSESKGGELVREWEGQAVYGNCNKGSGCAEQFGGVVQMSYPNAIIPCHKETCQEVAFDLQSLATFAATPAYQALVASLKAEAGSVTPIATWDEAKAAAGRIGSRFTQAPWETFISGGGDKAYRFFTQHMEFSKFDELRVTGYYCVEGETCEKDVLFTDWYLDLKKIDPESIRTSEEAVLGEDTSIWLDCAGGQKDFCIEVLLAEGSLDFNGMPITCRTVEDCDATAADLRGLRAFLENPPSGQQAAPKEQTVEEQKQDGSKLTVAQKILDDAVAELSALIKQGEITLSASEGRFLRRMLGTGATLSPDGRLTVGRRVCMTLLSMDIDMPNECRQDTAFKGYDLTLYLAQIDPDSVTTRNAARELGEEGAWVQVACRAGSACAQLLAPPQNWAQQERNILLNSLMDNAYSPRVRIPCKAGDGCDRVAKALRTLVKAMPKPVQQATDGSAAKGDSLVGTWTMQVPPLQGWVTEFRADGSFVSNNAGTLVTGTYQAKNGVLHQQIPAINLNRTVSYRFIEKDLVEFKDDIGQSTWKRTAGGG